MVTQGLLPFQYQIDETHKGTSLAGLPLFIDMARISGLYDNLEQKLSIKKQGWRDSQILLSLILLNLSGGDCVDDIERLEADPGMRSLLLRLETHGMKRKQRRQYERCFRKDKSRAFPSTSVIRRYLESYHDESEEKKRVEGHAFIPAANEHLQTLSNLNDVLVQFLQKKQPQDTATLDQDATLIETTKRTAYFCYKKFKAYQPFNTYWNEQSLLLHSEFRDGNVPASFEQLRCLESALSRLPASVKRVYLRSDSAGYQEEVLAYCAEGKNNRFGVIEFAISARLSKGFKKAVEELNESDWKAVYKTLPNGERIKTEQEWAEVCFVPAWAAKRKTTPNYRFIAIRELAYQQLVLEGMEKEASPSIQENDTSSIELSSKKYKVYGLVTNRHLEGNELIQWYRARCGASEMVHGIQKTDLSGGQLPSNQFGANAAWWQIMIMTLNLSTLMKQLVLPDSLNKKRMKGLRFHLIGLAGQVITHARGIVLKLSGDSETTRNLLLIRRRLEQLAMPPAVLNTS